jgi:hypothetical protein
VIRPRTARLSGFVLIAILGLGLGGCATSSPETGATKPSSESQQAEPEQQEQPADLVGEWVQSNSASADSYQSATIAADTIEINWISETDDTRALYWAGTYEAPTTAGPFDWASQNDTSKTDSAMLASSDPTKNFSYNDGVISYEVTAMGVTKTVKLERKG